MREEGAAAYSVFPSQRMTELEYLRIVGFDKRQALGFGLSQDGRRPGNCTTTQRRSGLALHVLEE